MFEQYDFDYLLEEMLSNVSDEYDKREGSIIYDALAPIALTLANHYIVLDMMANEIYADSASYYFLIKRAAERGLTPHEETSAICKMIVTPSDCEITAGDRFNLGELNYAVVEPYAGEAGAYRIECETAGTIGNQQKGTLLPIEYIEGLETAELTEVIVAGADEEDVEHFRERYFEAVNSRAFGGNIADYKEKALEQREVGAIKVYPVWNGGGTVKLVFLNSAYNAPDEGTVQQIQTLFDPEQNHGEGLGLAPIGHVVTVKAAEEVKINIRLHVDYVEGQSQDTAAESIKGAVESYLASVRLDWGNGDKDTGVTVRISYIENQILDCSEVLDVQVKAVNEQTNNLQLESEQIPVIGELTYEES